MYTVIVWSALGDRGVVHMEINQWWHEEWSDRRGGNLLQRVSTADAIVWPTEQSF